MLYLKIRAVASEDRPPLYHTCPRLSIGNFNKNSPKSRTNLVQSAQTPRPQHSLGKPCRTFLHKKNTFPAPFIVQ